MRLAPSYSDTFDIAGYNRRFPFNNFGKIFLANGEDFPSEELGGNCVWHARKLTNMLTLDGYENIRYGQAVSGGHLVVVASKDGRNFLFDRFLSHNQGICLDDIKEFTIIDVDANPIVNKKPSLVQAYFSTPERPNEAGQICLTTRKKLSNGTATLANKKIYSYD